MSTEYFPIALGDKTIRVQLAITPAEQEQGLMWRESLGADEGMLFVFSEDSRRYFWMQNTLLNLNLGFFTADGRLNETQELFAHDTTQAVSASDRIRFVLELNAGWFAKNNIATGTQLDLSAVYYAVLAAS
jgi:uncharacterized membrane protein (UPF0127 family)